MQAGGITYRFGRFVLEPQRRALLAEGAALPVSARAFDVLQLLIENRDRVLGKDEIITRVWRGVAVEENNLAVQISALRKLLADPASPSPIATIPGHGYRFVAEVTEIVSVLALPESFQPEPEQPSPVTTQPVRLTGRRLAVAGVACALAAIAFLLASPGHKPPAPSPAAPRLSLVIMPFRNLSGDPKQDYLADAVSDDLTTDLSHIPGSTVIARASSDTYKGRAATADEIGRALHVRYLLEGSVRGQDGLFRINAQLIDTANGAHLWADRFDVAQGHVSDAQTTIVRHIASALDVTLVDIEGARSLHDRPDDPDALDLFFRARSIMNGAQTLAQFSQAQALLDRAIHLRPDFAEAQSTLGLLLLAKGADFDDPDDTADDDRAHEAIARALELAPKSADTLAAQGALLASDERYQEALASYDASVAAAPNNTLGRAGRAVCAWRLAKPEAAIAELQGVLRLDPLGPSVKKRHAMLGMASFMQGQWNDSVGSLLSSLAGDPRVSAGSGSRSEWSHAFLIADYEKLGQHNRARQAFAEFDQTWPHRSAWRMASYFSHAQASLPRFHEWTDALIAAGMPAFADENTAPSDAPGQDSDFDPVPATVAGATTIDTAQIRRLLREPQPPLVIDVGPGAAVIPNAQWLPHGLTASKMAELTKSRGIVVMSAGPLGREGYDSTKALVKAGFQTISWYRGGEEAWAASGATSNDLREP